MHTVVTGSRNYFAIRRVPPSKFHRIAGAGRSLAGPLGVIYVIGFLVHAGVDCAVHRTTGGGLGGGALFDFVHRRKYAESRPERELRHHISEIK